MDQRPNSAKTSLGNLGRRSTLNDDRNGKRVSYDETRLKTTLDLSEDSGGYKASSLPRSAKIGNSSTDGASVAVSSGSLRKTDGNGKKATTYMKVRVHVHSGLTACLTMCERTTPSHIWSTVAYSSCL